VKSTVSLSILSPNARSRASTCSPQTWVRVVH